MKVLNRFAEASGGRAWEISESSFGKNLEAVLDTIAAELRSQYSIGYYPEHPVKDGKWHSVGIRMKNPTTVRASARNTSTSEFAFYCFGFGGVGRFLSNNGYT
jgi:hypothetical protein